MKILKSSKDWLENNKEIAYPFIRIFLGLALLIRGVILISDPASITELAGSDQYYWWYSFVIVSHVIGGALMAVGLLTRIAALLQIPVLFGAVFIFHLKQGLANVEQSLELSTLVLVLLIIFFLFGSGKLSVDNYIFKKKEQQIDE